MECRTSTGVDLNVKQIHLSTTYLSGLLPKGIKMKLKNRVDIFPHFQTLVSWLPFQSHKSKPESAVYANSLVLILHLSEGSPILVDLFINHSIFSKMHIYFVVSVHAQLHIISCTICSKDLHCCPSD